MDTKLQTFLTLCTQLNYRETAKLLHLSQPAVTKQIQQLEQIYGVKLFYYDGRKLHITEQGRIFEQYAKSIQFNYHELQKALRKEQETFVRIGATKTIGDYVIGDAIAAYLSVPTHNLSLVVDNTEHLLKMLDDNQLDFALIEGVFHRSEYDFELLQQEPFVGICAASHPLNGKTVSLSDILCETIIVREHGSGTRNILEQELFHAGYTLSDFKKCTSISSFKLICELVAQNLGISFVYESVVRDDPKFGRFALSDWSFFHEFNIVYLKNTNAAHYVQLFFADPASCSG